MLFADPLNRRVVVALAGAGSLAEALEQVPEDLADLFHQLAAEETDATPEEAFLRLSREASGRALRSVRQQAAAGPVDPATMSGVRALSLWHDHLGDYERPQDERLHAGVELLAWLLAQGEERG
jgi:hypothetical protein